MTKLTAAGSAILEKYRAVSDSDRFAALRAGFFRTVILRKLREIPARIWALSGGLRTSVGNESSFLDIGRTLQTIYGETADLIQFIQETVKSVMGDTEENILGKVSDLAKRAETALTRHQQRVAGSLVQIKKVADHLDGLQYACDYLGRISMTMRVVGLNIGVESTRSDRGRDMFTVVSQEILQLSESVGDIAARLREDATAATAEQMKAFQTISDGLRMLEELTAKASGVVKSAVNEADKGMAAFLNAFETADRRFQEISSQVGEIVMGIQFHDNMRQRVEHITDALDASGRTFRDPDAGRSKPEQGLWESKKEALGDACAVVTLQKVQLADLVEEINRVFRESVTAFEGIGSDIQDLADIMSAVSIDKGTGRDPFSKLTDALTGLGGLLDQGDALGRRILDSITKASEISRRFSKHLKDVDKISFETKIKALNAIVKAGHMSEEGRTLEVLAQEMNRLSQLTNNFVDSVEEKLTKVGQFGELLQDEKSDSEETKKRHELFDLSEALVDGIEELVRMRNLMNQRAGEASEKADTLRAMAARTVSELDFLTALAREMSGHLDVLNAINLELAEMSKKWNLGGGDRMKKLAGTYTMQRERKIHHRVFREKKALQEKTGSEDTPPRPSEPEGDISLWDDVEEAPEIVSEESPPKKKDDDDLGENIELF